MMLKLLTDEGFGPAPLDGSRKHYPLRYTDYISSPLTIGFILATELISECE